MSYETTWKLLNDEAFKGRLQVAVYTLALGVADNPPPAEDDPDVEAVLAQQSYARSVVYNPTGASDNFLYPVAMNPTVVTAAETSGSYDQSQVTDAQINAAAIAAFNKIISRQLSTAAAQSS